MFVLSKCGDLQNIWSMRVQDFFALRVGRVILGKKILVHIKAKNSLNFSLSFICKGFILKSADYCSIFIFLLEWVNYGRNLFDKSLDIGIIVVVVWWFVNVADSNMTTKILTLDIDE